MKGFSNTRWLSREEVCNELAKNFHHLSNFVDMLVEDGIGDALPQKMKEILSNSGEYLQVELACNLDLEPTIIKTCMSLEGDGLAVWHARSKLDALLSWGDSLGDEASSMPNVAALLRSRVDVHAPGTEVYEFFADVVLPKWFKGEVVAPRQQGLFTIRY